MSYLTATLTDAELHVISDPTKYYEHAVAELKSISDSLHADENDFEISLRIRNTLVAYEEKARTEPSEQVLAVLLNGEYRLWIMNSGTEIEVNPFLSHWIEAIVRLEKAAAEAPHNAVVANSSAHNAITTEEICAIRADVIKSLIWVGNMQGLSPQETRQLAVRKDLLSVAHFGIRRYMQMLVDNDIWDPSDMPELPEQEEEEEEEEEAAPNGKNAVHKPVVQEEKNPEQWQQVMLRKLKQQPDNAVEELTRLPIELTYLDFLSKLLDDRTLEKYHIDSSSIIVPYIQHALRLVEKMEAPPPTTEQDLPTNGSPADGVENGTTIAEYGKEAQSRAVILLLLFIKNLIRKDLYSTGLLIYEIQEICVRYVWLKEVREFRTWIEEGG